MRAIVVVALLARLAHAECDKGKALPIARGPIVVDGVLDDPTWQKACFAEDFEQLQPKFGKPPSHPVKVAVAIDGDTLYVGARMWSANRDDIDDALTQRDDTSQAERFIVSLDPSHTKRIAYSFAVTAAGVRADWIHTDDSEGDRDLSWNPVWVAKTQIYADGWSAEMAIPLGQLRLPREPAASWGINFDWFIPHRQEDVFWRAVPPDRTAWASYFGELTELPPVQPRLGLELLPYVAARVTGNEVAPPQPAHRWLAGFEAGLDAKLRPLPGLTIAATINPDFGQVDADPAFVNLTAYEVHLPEKRPFFIENNSLFGDTESTYFYSRRIGGLPLTLPAYDEADLPPQVRILGAAAAGGYVESHTQIAALAAVTDRADANAIVDGVHAPIAVSPLTGWAAARVEHQIGASVLGGTVTAVDRALGGTGLSAILPETATVAAADARLRTSDGTWELYDYAGLSAITGTAAAITSVEERSAHYFQRPDQPHVHLDTDAHHLIGWQAGVEGTKRSGLWQGSAGAHLTSPGFELNDIGALDVADLIDTSVEVRRRDTVPGERLFSWEVAAGGDQRWNFGGLRRPTDLNVEGDLTTLAFNSASLTANFYSPGENDNLTRGGPRMGLGWAGNIIAAAETPFNFARQWSGQLELEVSPTAEQGVIASGSFTDRIVSSLRLDITPSLSVVETHLQYVATVTDAGGGEDTYGARYVFGHLHRKDAAIELRATWSLSPDLVITLYAQPFVSVGRYDELGELAAAGSDQIRWYTQLAHAGASRSIVDGGAAFSVPEPDYTVASLRSTAVLRWELRPGSTLFIVWQQSRGGVAVPVAQPLHGALPDVFTQSAIHTLAIKLSWWFG